MGVHLDGSTVVGVSRLEVIEGPSGRRRRTKAERARIAAESLVPGVTVADVARRHGTTRWQVYDWRKKLRTGQLVVPESVAALPMFAELVVEDTAGRRRRRCHHVRGGDRCRRCRDPRRDRRR